MKCIYLFNHNGNKYVGSTKDYNMRLQAHNQHKKQSKYNNTLFYQYLINNAIDDCREFITPICEYTDVFDKKNKLLLEQHFIDTYKPQLNSCKAINLKNKVWNV